VIIVVKKKYKPSPKRKFNGRYYKLSSSTTHGQTKFTTNSLKKNLKKRGYKTRTVKKGKNYYLYIRK